MKLSKSELSSWLICFEILGFLFLVILLWLNEWLDLPYLLFGAPKTPMNLTESIFETVIVALLCLAVVGATRRLIRKIQYLQGILPICSYCKKVRIEDKWEPVDVYVRKHSAAEFSHGLCPECLKKFYESEGED